MPTPPTGGGGVTSVIPPLTDHQKKIVADFKARIANLPPDQQQAYIAQNKRNLLYKLNFQPSQLHVLQGSRPPQQPGPSLPAVPPLGPQTSVRTFRPSQQPQPEQLRPPLIHLPPGLQPSSGGSGPMPLRPPPSLLPEAVVLQPPAATASVDFPAGVARLQPPTLPTLNKANKIAWAESQIKKDQHEAVNPNYRNPFISKDDAIKRLMRYHVFDEPGLSLEEWNQSEDNFEKKSISLLGKYHSMLSKYHILLLQESTRLCSSSEEVMLARHWESDERDTLRKEKEEFARYTNRIADLSAKASLEMQEMEELDGLLEQAEPTFPAIPESWHTKYEEMFGEPYEPYIVRKEDVKQRVFSRKTEKVESIAADSAEETAGAAGGEEQSARIERLAPLTPVSEVDIKREPDTNAEMPVLEDERLFRYSAASDTKTSARSRNSSQASLDSFRSFRSRNDSGASRKELRISLTNVLNPPPHLKESGGISGLVTANSRPQSSTCSSPEPGASFVGLKFNRTTSGRWSASLKRELEEGESGDDEDEGEGDRSAEDQGSRVSASSSAWKKSRLSPTFGSDSDEDFSLADVGGEAAVRSMLAQADEEEDEEGRDSSRLYTNVNLFGGGIAGGGSRRNTPNSEAGDNDSVQNAINSILDMHDRGGMQTPDDLNNLTGLLDSIEDDDDPNLDAAVKSITGLL